MKKADIRNIKKSYYNILAFFLKEQKTEDQIIHSLFKWGIHLGLHAVELKSLINKPALLTYTPPKTTSDALEEVYDIVFMIHLDDIVEDIELEVITAYAENVGLHSQVVDNILKALITAPGDGLNDNAVRKEIKEHPEVYM